MARDWLERGLGRIGEREEQQRRIAERRRHQAAVIEEKGPDLMRRLVEEVGAVVAEFRQRAPAGNNEIDLVVLPHEGFCVTKSSAPKVSLECRPGYEARVVHCDRTRAGDPQGEAQETVFSLAMTVDDSDRLALRHETVTFSSVADVVEFLLKPVLFPPVDSEPLL